MFERLGCALGLVCIGLLARRFGIPLAWVASGLVFVLVAPGYFLPPGAAEPGRVGRRAASRWGCGPFDAASDFNYTKRYR